jgi:hypothetical protein
VITVAALCEQLAGDVMKALQVDPSSDEVIDRIAHAVGLAIPPDVRTGVVLAFDGLGKAAAEIMDFPLFDAESAPVIAP